MLDTLDIAKFNFPDSFKEAFQKQMADKNSEHIASRASYAAFFTTIVIEGGNILADKFWEENETAFLQHGTKKEECVKFAKELIISMFSEIFDDLSANVRDDVSDQ